MTMRTLEPLWTVAGVVLVVIALVTGYVVLAGVLTVLTAATWFVTRNATNTNSG